MGLKKPLNALATKLITKFGRNVTLVKITKGAYNPDTGSSDIKTESTIRVVLGKYNIKSYNDMIKIGDIPITTVAEISDQDQIIISGKTYDVTLVQPTPVEDGIVVYDANIRGI